MLSVQQSCVEASEVMHTNAFVKYGHGDLPMSGQVAGHR